MPMHSRLIALFASCVLVAGPARAGDAPAADTSSLWFPWQGVLIGAVAGGGGGYLLARSSCNSGGTVLSCDGLAAIGSVSMGLIGALLGGVIQGLVFWPEPSAPARPLGAMSVSLLPRIDVEGTTSLSLAVHF